MKEKLAGVERAVAGIVLIYLLLGLTWIFFSDNILALLASDPAQFKRYGTYKGVVFIAFTATLLYFLVRRALRQRLAIEQSLQASEERWKFALEGAGEGVWDWNLQTD